jgi:peptidoglycan/xylan/chitin deacetylase (PgdA/CDA1 family)
MTGTLAAVVAACSASGSRSRSGAARVSTTSAPTTPVSTRPTSTVPAPTIAPTTTIAAGGPARFVERGSSDAPPRVALTFHTGLGTAGLVKPLLDAGRAVSAPMTLMVIGSWLEANPSIAGALTADGHEIGNHTYSHGTLLQMPAAQALTEIQRCADVLQRMLGTRGLWLRPSGTEVSSTTAVVNAAAGRAGYGVVLGFDIDPHDYQDPGAAVIQQRVLAALQPGAIVSLHSGHQGTVDALEPLVGAIHARGYQLVKVSDIVVP